MCHTGLCIYEIGPIGDCSLGFQDEYPMDAFCIIIDVLFWLKKGPVRLGHMNAWSGLMIRQIEKEIGLDF